MAKYKKVKPKSPSLVLRNMLYRLWESEGKVGTSEEFYREKMGKIIGWVQNKIKNNGN